MSPSKRTKSAPSPYVADPGVRIGHVHLKVANLERALEFYSGILGLEITQRLGDSAVFLSAGGYHHHIALNTWESLDGPPPGPGHDGPLSHRDSLPEPCSAGRSAETGSFRRNSSGRGGRPRRQRVDLPARPRRQRSGIISRQTEGGLAADIGWQARDVHAPAGSARPLARTCARFARLTGSSRSVNASMQSIAEIKLRPGPYGSVLMPETPDPYGSVWALRQAIVSVPRSRTRSLDEHGIMAIWLTRSPDEGR